MYGFTLKETHHGNPGEKRILPKDMRVKLRPASNLPDDSPIKYWASPIKGFRWPADTVQWAKNVGVGLCADDVDIHGVTVRVDCKPCEGCGEPFYVDGCLKCGNGIDGRFVTRKVEC